MTTYNAIKIVDSQGAALGTFMTTDKVRDARELAKWSIKLAREFKLSPASLNFVETVVR